MKVNVESLSSISRKLSIELEPAVVNDAFEAAYRSLARDVKVPGFRAGHVPRRVLEQRYGPDVRKDVGSRLVQFGINSAISEHKLPVVGDPEYTSKLPELNAAFSFEAKVEIRPDITAKSYTDVKLTKRVDVASADKVEEQLTRLRERVAEVKEVEGRDVAKQGDLAIVRFESTIDGQPFAGSKADDARFRVKAGELVEGNVLAIEGMKKGETKNFDYTFPAEGSRKEIAGKTAKFVLTLDRLESAELPAIDDELGEKIFGEKLSAADVTKRIEADLSKSVKAQADADTRTELFEKLIAANTFDVPEAMVLRACDALIENVVMNMARSGVDVRQLGLNIDEMRKGVRERAEREVRGQLILEAVAKQEKLEVGEADLNSAYEEIAAEHNASLTDVRRAYRDPEALESLTRRVLQDKALEFVKSKAKFN